jgi:glycosyltransferase involved in cell wall biosynthesis
MHPKRLQNDIWNSLQRQQNAYSMIVVTHPTGNRNVRGVLSGLFDAGLLTEYATTLAVNRSAFWLCCVPTGPKRELLRRTYDIPLELVWSRPWREVTRMLVARGLFAGLARHETGWASVDAVYRDLDAYVAHRLPGLKNVRGVYAYEDGACNTFAAAAQMGIKRFYDLPIAYWETTRRLLDEEAELRPEWAPTLTGSSDSEGKVMRKEEELRLAEVVFCPSAFVADSLPNWAKESKRIFVVPFGSPSTGTGTDFQQDARSATRGQLRVLFVGSMGQRKGLADVFEAMKQLARSDIELIVMGSLLAPMDFYRRQFPDFVYEPPRPHAEVLRLMQTCDVFVLPSIVEGRALVVQEAMSQGLPIVITAHTGGEDLVEPERTGFLVPIRSPEAIADRLAWFADHRDETRAMGGFARAKAAEYTWANYGAKIVGAIGSALQA